MKNYLLGFIGTGNMGGALVKAANRVVDCVDILIYNRTAAKAQALCDEIGCDMAASALEVAANAKFIFLGVKPYMMEDLLATLKGTLAARTDKFVLVNMAGGVSCERIQALAGGNYATIRICPNTPCAVGRGLTLWCSKDSTEALDNELAGLMAGSGVWEHCDEHLLGVAGVTGGCTPAFAAMFIEAIADGAVRCGLPRATAIRYAALAVEGTGALAAEGLQHPGEMKDAVCSPGGSTIVGVNTLEEHAFRAAVMDAIVASCGKTSTMGK